MANGFEPAITALAYKSGMTDSVITSYDADYTNGTRCGGGAMMMGAMSMPTMVTTTTYSVWDGDWAIREEYDSTGARTQGYVEGYHGLVKILVDNVYYYQDEVGSTSHLATSTGALIESYQYDVYGKPRVYDSAGYYQVSATPRAQFLQGGARWMTEIGLYDDRNRFMSPDLGRFLQPDPIGFKGDASNLYRYCGNDWANRVDPMGTQDQALGFHYQELGAKNIQNAKDDSDTKEVNDNRSFQEHMSAGEVEQQANVDSQHPANMAHARAEARDGANFSLAPKESFSASVLTAIHPPDLQYGLKSIQSVTVYSDGSPPLIPDPYVGYTTVGHKFQGSSEGTRTDVNVAYPNFSITMRGHFASWFNRLGYPQPIDYKIHINGSFLAHRAWSWGKRDGYPSGVIFGGGQRMYEWHQHVRADLGAAMGNNFASDAVQW